MSTVDVFTMLLKDVDENHPLMQDVLRDQKTQVGDSLKCIKCGEEYKRGSWDFYSLCNECFGEFDSQKMRGRFSGFSGEKFPHFEDVSAWLESIKNTD